MNKLTNDEISKLDKIIIFLNDNKVFQYEKSYIAEKFNLSIEEYDFLYSKIVDFSLNEFTIGNILDKNSRYPSIECNFSTSLFIKNGGFKQYFKSEKKNNTNKKSEIGQSIIASNVTINNGNIKTLNQERSLRKKSKWDIIGIISITIALLVFLFGDNVCDRIKSKMNNSKSDNAIVFKKYEKKFDLPYLESFPILDKGLFIQHHYGELIFGGSNIIIVKINARRENGEKIEIKKDDNNNLNLDIFTKPYIEFYYKKEFYSMEIETLNYGESFVCKLKKIKSPTLKLIEFDKI